MGPHQKQMLQIQLRHIDFLESEITMLDAEVKARMSPFEEDLERLDTIPGVGRSTAEQIVAEAGLNVQEQFGSAPGFVRGQASLQVKTKAQENEKTLKLEKGIPNCEVH